MADRTPKYLLPYPQLPDVPDVPGDIKRLADRTEVVIDVVEQQVTGVANNAQQSANHGIALAQQAQVTANDATAIGVDGRNRANNAQGTADHAVNLANQAQNTANNANATIAGINGRLNSGTVTTLPASGNGPFQLMVKDMASQSYIRYMSNSTYQVANITWKTSDRRTKEAIEPAAYDPDAIHALHPVTFRFTEEFADILGVGTHLGFIAQDVPEVARTTPADPDEMLGIEDRALIAILVAEVQSLRARLDAMT
jgi:exoribonuclease R